MSEPDAKNGDAIRDWEEFPSPGIDPHSGHVSNHLRGETMAFAAQNMLSNVVWNFLEPIAGVKFQKYFSNRTHDGPSGTYAQNVAGEFAGDAIGSSTLFLAELAVPEQLHGASRVVRKMVDPIYAQAAEIVFAKDKNDPDIEQRKQEWKVFQERNLVRSGVIMGAGIAGNLATQKWLLNNPSTVIAIFKGKLLTTALSSGAGLAIRAAFPEQMHGMDEWMSKKLFEPMLENTESDKEKTDEKNMRHDKPVSFVDKEMQRRAVADLAPDRISAQI